MGRQEITLADRARGGLVGLSAGARLAGLPAGAAGPALARCVAEELVEHEPDFHRLAGRWVTWWRRDGRGVTDRTALALDHLARFDAPAPAGPGDDEAEPLLWALPIAIALAGQPRNLVSATYHAVLLTHPSPHAAWSAVATNIAAARFLLGKRDFVPDVIEALVANDAPGELLSTLRRVPFASRDELRPDRPVEGQAVALAGAVLWTAHQEPVLARGVTWLLGRGGAGAVAAPAALGCGLLGIRDGIGAIPESWMAPLEDLEELRELARRLGRAGPAQPGIRPAG